VNNKISEGLKRYWASGGAAGRRAKGGAVKSVEKRTGIKPAGIKPGVAQIGAGNNPPRVGPYRPGKTEKKRRNLNSRGN